MQNTVFLEIVICILIFLFFSFLLRKSLGLALTLYSSPFQIYSLPVLGVYPSITLISSLALWHELFKKNGIIKWRPVRLLLLLIIIQMLSLFWSADILFGLRIIIYSFPFLTILATAYNIASSKPWTVRSFLKIFPFFAIIEALLVMLFRIYPDFESTFLHSQYARYFITSNILDILFDAGRNNVLDPMKSGGFFVNANSASCFLGICSFITGGVGYAYRLRLLKCMAIFLWIAILFTGSKTGVGLAIVLPFTAWLISASFIRRRLLARITLIMLLLGVLSISFPYLILSDFIHMSGESFNVRLLIWNYAWREFLAHPLLGQGFGGWQLSYANYAYTVGLQNGIPPHNTLIYLWSQSGIFALFLGVIFIISIIGFGWRILRSNSSEVKALGIGTTFAFLWLFIHGMGDNTGIVGDIHMQPILATALGFTYARFEAKQFIKE